jgi:hypothetical protein
VLSRLASGEARQSTDASEPRHKCGHPNRPIFFTEIAKKGRFPEFVLVHLVASRKQLTVIRSRRDWKKRCAFEGLFHRNCRNLRDRIDAPHIAGQDVRNSLPRPRAKHVAGWASGCPGLDEEISNRGQQ